MVRSDYSDQNPNTDSIWCLRLKFGPYNMNSSFFGGFFKHFQNIHVFGIVKKRTIIKIWTTGEDALRLGLVRLYYVTINACIETEV